MSEAEQQLSPTAAVAAHDDPGRDRRLAGRALRDDPEYDDVRDVKDIHRVFKLRATWWRVKELFELAQPADMAEDFSPMPCIRPASKA